MKSNLIGFALCLSFLASNVAVAQQRLSAILLDFSGKGIIVHDSRTDGAIRSFMRVFE